MEFTYERKINYYETDRIGVVHHSNYIKFLEEARCAWMEQMGIPFAELERNGITIPVLAVNCEYKHHVTFGDTINIKIIIKEYSGVRMTVEYDVREKNSGNVVIICQTKHCFTNMNLKPINLKKHAPNFSRKFEEEMK